MGASETDDDKIIAKSKWKDFDIMQFLDFAQ